MHTKTVNEVAKAMQFSEQTIRNWAKSGYIPAKKRNGKWMFSEKKLAEWFLKKAAQSHK